MQGFWTEMLIYKDHKNADNIHRLCICEVFNIYIPFISFIQTWKHHKDLQRIFQKLELVFCCQNPILPSLTATFSFGLLSCMYCSSLVTNMLDIENLKIKTMSHDSLWHTCTHQIMWCLYIVGLTPFNLKIDVAIDKVVELFTPIVWRKKTQTDMKEMIVTISGKIATNELKCNEL